MTLKKKDDNLKVSDKEKLNKKDYEVYIDALV